MTRLFSIAALAAALALSHPAAAGDIRYEAVWHSGEQPSLHTAPLSRQAFLQSGQQLAETGWIAIDIETAIRGGRRVYAGLWTKGTGSNIFEGPMGPIELREARERHRAQGHILSDFEMFRTRSGGRRYVGIWINGTGDEVLTGPMQQDAFFARGEQETQAGKRLKDVEVEVRNGTLLYSGLFQTGTGSNFLTEPLPRGAFTAKRDEMVANGLALTDVERVTIDGTDKFVGVWSSGDGESRLSVPRDFEPYFVFAQSQFNADKHTEDFELQRIASGSNGTDGDGTRGGVDTSDLPDNPPGISLTGDERLVIEWTHDTDNPFTMELPRSWLPAWLPHKDGEPVLPDTFCALNIRRADTIFWQVPGDPAVETPPFLATPSVSALGSEFFLGGVDFAGPFGACTGMQTEFQFDFPFTTGEVPFEPLENMRLVIEGLGSSLSGGTEIDFMPAGAPNSEVPSAFELYKDFL